VCLKELGAILVNGIWLDYHLKHRSSMMSEYRGSRPSNGIASTIDRFHARML